MTIYSYERVHRVENYTYITRVETFWYKTLTAQLRPACTVVESLARMKIQGANWQKYVM